MLIYIYINLGVRNYRNVIRLPKVQEAWVNLCPGKHLLLTEFNNDFVIVLAIVYSLRIVVDYTITVNKVFNNDLIISRDYRMINGSADENKDLAIRGSK